MKNEKQDRRKLCNDATVSKNTNILYICVQRLLGHADLQMAARYVQDVSAQTARERVKSGKNLFQRLRNLLTNGVFGRNRFKHAIV